MYPLRSSTVLGVALQSTLLYKTFKAKSSRRGAPKLMTMGTGLSMLMRTVAYKINLKKNYYRNLFSPIFSIRITFLL